MSDNRGCFKQVCLPHLELHTSQGQVVGRVLEDLRLCEDQILGDALLVSGGEPRLLCRHPVVFKNKHVDFFLSNFIYVCIFGRAGSIKIQCLPGRTWVRLCFLHVEAERQPTPETWSNTERLLLASPKSSRYSDKHSLKRNQLPPQDSKPSTQRQPRSESQEVSS